MKGVMQMRALIQMGLVLKRRKEQRVGYEFEFT